MRTIYYCDAAGNAAFGNALPQLRGDAVEIFACGGERVFVEHGSLRFLTYPILAAQEEQTSALRNGLGRIESAISKAFREQQTALSKTVTDETKRLEQQLRTKDFTPLKTRFLWWAAGTALPLILWGLLWIFKIW